MTRELTVAAYVGILTALFLCFAWHGFQGSKESKQQWGVSTPPRPSSSASASAVASAPATITKDSPIPSSAPLWQDCEEKVMLCQHLLYSTLIAASIPFTNDLLQRHCPALFPRRKWCPLSSLISTYVDPRNITASCHHSARLNACMPLLSSPQLLALIDDRINEHKKALMAHHLKIQQQEGPGR